MLFEESMIVTGGRKKKTKSWLTFPLSLLLHLVLLAAVVVAPLMNADSNLPEVKVINVLMSAPPPPPPPPPPPAKKAASKAKVKSSSERPEKKEERRPVISGRLVAPVEIPEEIEEEDVSDFGIDGGIEGGIEGGVEGGVIGGVLGGVLTDSTDTSDAIRVSTVQRPKLIRRVEPEYPSVALKARIRGRVIVEAVTDIYGRVRDARIISGHPLLNANALAAVKQWIYEPYIVNGVPKPVKFTVIITFSLQQ